MSIPLYPEDCTDCGRLRPELTKARTTDMANPVPQAGTIVDNAVELPENTATTLSSITGVTLVRHAVLLAEGTTPTTVQYASGNVITISENGTRDIGNEDPDSLVDLSDIIVTTTADSQVELSWSV